jgi:hypothetical protein
MLWIRTLVLKAFLVGEVLSDFCYSANCKTFMHSHIDVCVPHPTIFSKFENCVQCLLLPAKATVSSVCLIGVKIQMNNNRLYLLLARNSYLHKHVSAICISTYQLFAYTVIKTYYPYMWITNDDLKVC